MHPQQLQQKFSGKPLLLQAAADRCRRLHLG
jgi:hypothetical protein